MKRTKSDSVVKVFQSEVSIHVLAATLNDFFKEMYLQPQETWSQIITDTLLVPFLKRPALPQACFFGERNPVAHQLLQPGIENRQNWFEWLLPLFMMEDIKEATNPLSTPSISSPSSSSSPSPSLPHSHSVLSPLPSAAFEPMESIAILLTVACLYWTFLNRSPEELGLACSEMQTKFELLGWNDMHVARLRAIYLALVTKIVRTSVLSPANDPEHRLWAHTNTLVNAIEELCFYSPLYGFGIKPDAAIVGVHLNRNGFQNFDLLRSVTDMVLALLGSASESLVRMDKKEKRVFMKQKETMEETGSFLSSAFTWALSLKSVSESVTSLATSTGKKEKAFCPGPEDGSHVKVYDRVIVRSKQGKLYPALLLYKGISNDKVMLGVSFDDDVGGNDGTLNGTNYFTCTDGHGAFVTPDCVQRQETPPNPMYEKSSLQLLEAMMKRPRFKLSNKKQAKDCLDQALYTSAQMRVKPPKHDSLTATFADVPLDTLLEHARVGSATIKCMIRHIEKQIEILLTFASVLEKNLQTEEIKNSLGEDMVSCREALDIMRGLENSLNLRVRVMLSDINNNILVPFQLLVSEYEAAAVQLTKQHAKNEQEIANKRAEMDAELEEANRDYQDFLRELSKGVSKKLVPLRQRCTMSFVRYEQSCVEWKFVTYRDLKLAQDNCFKEFQRMETKRLAAVQAWTQRYVASFAAFASPYPAVRVHEETLSGWSPENELARFSAAAAVPDPMPPLGKLPCSSTELLSTLPGVTSSASSERASPNGDKSQFATVDQMFPVTESELQENGHEPRNSPRQASSRRMGSSKRLVSESKSMDSFPDHDDSFVTDTRSSISDTPGSRTRTLSDTPPPESESDEELPPDEVRPVVKPSPSQPIVQARKSTSTSQDSPSGEQKPSKPARESRISYSDSGEQKSPRPARASESGGSDLLGVEQKPRTSVSLDPMKPIKPVKLKPRQDSDPPSSSKPVVPPRRNEMQQLRAEGVPGPPKPSRKVEDRLPRSETIPHVVADK